MDVAGIIQVLDEMMRYLQKPNQIHQGLREMSIHQGWLILSCQIHYPETDP
jgi:hypothetical protein